MSGYDYLRDPDAIYRRSFELIRAAVDLSALPPGIDTLAERLIHACGMPDILPDFAWTPDLPAAVQAALKSGAPVLCDAEMVVHGVIRTRLPAANPVLCLLNDPAVPGLAREMRTTRSAAAVDLWRPHLGGAVVAIGNAPTALFRLLELLADGSTPRPAAILGFPVGFVGAAESKDALIADARGIPFATLRGRRGGSAMAAAALNALAVRGNVE